MKNLAVLALAALAVSACVTGPNPEAEIRAKAWAQVHDQTQALPVGDNRLRIVASTPFAAQVATLESDLLTRAAGEAVRRGADRFAIVFLEYDNTSLGEMLLPGFNDVSTDWIGTYEDLLAARAATDPDGSLKGNFGFKRATAVVRLLAPGEEPQREAFSAAPMYNALLADRIERKNIKPTRRIRF